MRVARIVPFVLAAAFSLSGTRLGVAAESGSVVEVPPLLQAWRGWVLKDLEYRSCPFVATQAPGDASAYVCAWPGRLQLQADARGAAFEQTWRVEAPSWIPLPGSSLHWPQQVQVNGQSAPVLLHDGQPALWLEAGTQRISARIAWSQRPQQLEIPAQIGLIDLRVDAKPVSPLQRSGNWLTLGRGEVAAPEADALELQVFRNLVDSVPARLETRIHLAVSGQAREESFGPVLPSGFVPIALDGGVPARLDSDGKLHVQAQPGAWDLVLHARLESPLKSVAARLAPEPWPSQEIWSFQAVPGLRVASISGELPIDPAQAGVPPDWRGLPAFALADGGVLSLEERSRGLSEDANRLQLSREAWLDFSGRGLYAKDRISGQLHRDWRLDVAAPFVLERADSGGEGLLITRGASADLSGVELHNSNVNISAGVRIAQRSGLLPVTGWQQAFDAVSLRLHLPYGWRLLAAPGADSAAGSWISRWTLLDVFLVAITALLGARLLGLPGGAAVLTYLVLGYHEPSAPLWSCFAALLLALLLRNLPGGRLQSVTRWLARGATVLFLLLALPFLVAQVRYALYPQLETGRGWGAGFDDGVFGGNADGYAQQRAMPNAPAAMGGEQDESIANNYPASAPAQELDAAPMPLDSPVSKSVAEEATRFRSAPGRQEAKKSASMNKNNMLQRYAQNTVIQSGRGEPGWQYGTTAQLSWSGPVLVAQDVRLLIAPPWMVRVLRVLMLGSLFGALGLLLGRLFAMRMPAWAGQGGKPVGALLLGIALCSGTPARAQVIPDQELLDNLRERLTEAPRCAPACASLARAQIRAQDDNVQLLLELHAGERVAIPLPGEEDSLALGTVRLDGIVQEGLARRDELLWLAVGRGVHQLDLSFTVTDADHVALKFPMMPARVELNLSGWQGSGVSEDRLLGDTLTLARERRETGGEVRATAQQFPPYVQVERSLVLDLEWRVESSAWRVAPASGGFAVSLPLLAGEQVLSSGVKVSDGAVQLSFGADQSQTQWSSRLERSDTLSLVAPPLGERAEVWKVVLSPTWHGEFSGIAEVQSTDGGEYWTHEFHPLPGETLSIRINRPEAVAGKTLAVDSVGVTSNVGKRAIDTTLDLGLRSTQGGEHAMSLPAAAEVLSVTRNGQSLNLRPRDGRLSIPLVPGAQRYQIRLRESQELGFRASTTGFDLGSSAANVQLALNLPGDRWVLFASGPSVGPAVLYWGELLVMIVLAVLLARTGRTPLRTWHWLLLGIGFSTASWFALGVVVVWLLALDWRVRRPAPMSAVVFNLAQIVLIALTLAALVSLIGAVYAGLLGNPDMGVVGNGSTEHALRWFADQSETQLPVASAYSVPLWVHKLAMLAWALWLAIALTNWLRWGYGAWSKSGYWRPLRPAVPTVSEAPILDVEAP